MIMAMSPRISFSHDIDPPADYPHPIDDSPHPTSSPDDFGFAISDIQDPSPADELFSQGKLLPLSSLVKPAATHPPPKAAALRNPGKIMLKDLVLSRSPSPERQSGGGAKSSSSSPPPFWGVGRSVSVGASKTGRSSSTKNGYFPRSKSTGSCHSDRNHNQRRSNCYYYSGSGKGSGGCENGVRINPVINVPAPFIPRGGSGRSCSSSSASSGGGNGSFFAYLLCRCRDKDGEEMEATWSP